MKIVPVVTMILLTGGILAGCGPTSGTVTPKAAKSVVAQSSSDSATTTSKQSSSQSTANSSSRQRSVTPWNTGKAQKLADFMQKWGHTMGQSYDQYGPGKDTNFYGAHYPTDFQRFPVAVDDQPVSVEWSKDGSGTKDYQIVDIYSDSKTAHYAEQHLYFFTLHHGKPVVLITMQNQWAPDEHIHFKATANQALASGFVGIVNGNTSGAATQGVTKSSQDKSSYVPELFNFPKEWQHTWYATDADGQKHQLKITAHSLITDGHGGVLYKSDGHDVNDMVYPERADWNMVGSPEEDLVQNKLIFTRGWYQRDSGYRYQLRTENVNGRDTTVLVSGGAANANNDVDYYQTPALADAATNHHYPDQDDLK